MPHPEDLVDDVAQVARDEEALGAASERKLAGTASAADEALLANMPEFLTAPLSEQRRGAVVDAIHARIANSERPKSLLVGVPSRAQRTPRGARLGVALMGATAMAAGIFVWLARAPNRGEPLSGYELRVVGALRSERSAAPATETLRLRPGTTVRFELRPQRDVRGDVAARVFVGGAASQALGELTTEQEQSTAGALRVDARLPDSLPAQGELLIDVGRRDALARVQPSTAFARPSLETQQFRVTFERTP
ncbi:MAG TPA: hypothetical protein VFQ35_05800 [Polyangiaceae bacterium]|nr:hypothetical protein [Polyangiaceae bacterium]